MIQRAVTSHILRADSVGQFSAAFKCRYSVQLRALNEFHLTKQTWMLATSQPLSLLRKVTRAGRASLAHSRQTSFRSHAVAELGYRHMLRHLCLFVCLSVCPSVFHTHGCIVSHCVQRYCQMFYSHCNFLNIKHRGELNSLTSYR